MRMSNLVSSLRKQTTTKTERKRKTKENHQTITTATNCCCGMVLAQCVRMKQKKMKTNNLIPKYTHAKQRVMNDVY